MATIDFSGYEWDLDPNSGVLPSGASVTREPSPVDPYTNQSDERNWFNTVLQPHIASKSFLSGVGSSDIDKAFSTFSNYRNDPTLNRGDAYNRTLDDLGWWTGTGTSAPKATTSTRTKTGNPQQDFMSLIAGLSPSTQSLGQIFPQFQEWYPGSSWERGDIKGPWGWADVIGDLGSGDVGKKWQWYTGSGGGSRAGGQYDDPATKMFEQQILDRLEQLGMAVNRPDDDRYRAAALSRVDELMKAPYTAAEEQALITRMRDPLTQARDTRQQFMKEVMGGRNIGPSSGLFADQVYAKPEQDYTRALAAGTNDLAVRGIDEKRSRNNQALDILANLVGLGRDVRTEDEGRAREALTTGAILPDLSERRLQLLMQTLGMGGTDTSGLSSSLLSLMNMNQQNSQFQAGQSQNNAATWGSILGYLVNSPLMSR